MFVRDADGDWFFVDRLKDAIRRRGENISSWEVEVEILGHPDVREAAVVAVPSEHTEDEVLAVLAPVAGRSIDPAAICAWLEPRLPRFMRSEEHTSELQSLMRISYAVFCLNKKNQI